MEFYAKINEEQIGIYHYEVNTEKLYQYKKEHIKQIDILSANIKVIYLSSQIDKIKKGNNINFCHLDFRDNGYFCGDKTYKSEKEQSELLEQYCNGTLHSHLYDNANYYALFPDELLIKDVCSVEGNLYVCVDGILRLTDDLYLLERLEKENVYFTEKEMGLLKNQLECFEFSDDPIDIISLKSLEVLYKDKLMYVQYPNYWTAPTIISETKDNSEIGSKLLQKVKINKNSKFNKKF